MALFCVAMKSHPFSFLSFTLLSHIHIIFCAIYLVCRLKYPYSWVFFCIFHASLHLCNCQYKRFSFLFFLTHKICLCNLSGVRPCVLSSIYWFFLPSVWVPLLSILCMLQSILQRRLPRCLFPWSDFCYRFLFPGVFLFFWGALYFFFYWLFVAASHQTGLDTKSKAQRPIKVEIKGEEGRERTETRTLLVCAAHRPTKCNVSQMSQAVSRIQIWIQARMPGYSLK